VIYRPRGGFGNKLRRAVSVAFPLLLLISGALLTILWIMFLTVWLPHNAFGWWW
jgi:hypothetical protein